MPSASAAASNRHRWSLRCTIQKVFQVETCFNSDVVLVALIRSGTTRTRQNRSGRCCCCQCSAGNAGIRAAFLTPDSARAGALRLCAGSPAAGTLCCVLTVPLDWSAVLLCVDGAAVDAVVAAVCASAFKALPPAITATALTPPSNAGTRAGQERWRQALARAAAGVG